MYLCSVSKDLFSSHAAQYATFRPTYPQALYDFIFAQVNAFGLAWDAGTGNGQVARDLSPHFASVWGTDLSQGQLHNAYRAHNIHYAQAAETTALPANAVDLICVAQAIHWFDRPAFYAEVRRVAKPDATIAVWGYGLLRIASPIDQLIDDFYVHRIGQYWDRERKLIDEHYQHIDFPFREITSPSFSISATWTLAQLQGYLTTWSAVQKFIHQHQSDPVPPLIEQIKPLWRHNELEISFPLFLRLGKIDDVRSS